MRLPVAVNRARRASCCLQGELRVELSGRQPCPTTCPSSVDKTTDLAAMYNNFFVNCSTRMHRSLYARAMISVLDPDSRGPDNQGSTVLCIKRVKGYARAR